MGLINIADIQTGDDATAELWNSRFATIVNAINGNIDSANLADGAVSSAKIASSAVTAGKISDSTITYAKLLDTIFSGQVQSQSNGGNAGGTLYYVNLGGIKVCWGTTSAKSVNSTVVSATVTFPSGFFNTVQTAVANPTSITTDDRVALHLNSVTESGMDIVWWNTAGLNTSTANAAFIVIGT